MARLFEKYGFLALPVVDMDKKLVGVITVDDVLDVAVEEVTEDIHKSASITPLETGYTDAGVWTLFSKRILWLVGLILVNLVSSGIIAAYEKVLASTITLVAFIPLLIGTGGNTGSQSATLIIRALVTGDVKLAEWGRVFLKELFVGICLGLVLGAAGTEFGGLPWRPRGWVGHWTDHVSHCRGLQFNRDVAAVYPDGAADGSGCGQ